MPPVGPTASGPAAPLPPGSAAPAVGRVPHARGTARAVTGSGVVYSPMLHQAIAVGMPSLQMTCDGIDAERTIGEPLSKSLFVEADEPTLHRQPNSGRELRFGQLSDEIVVIPAATDSQHLKPWSKLRFKEACYPLDPQIWIVSDGKPLQIAEGLGVSFRTSCSVIVLGLAACSSAPLPAPGRMAPHVAHRLRPRARSQA